LLLSTALYSAGAVGAKETSMSGNWALKAGMIVSRQMLRSSLRQLSIVRLPCWAAAHDGVGLP
jgi:hypothetical protein